MHKILLPCCTIDVQETKAIIDKENLNNLSVIEWNGKTGPEIPSIEEKKWGIAWQILQGCMKSKN